MYKYIVKNKKSRYKQITRIVKKIESINPLEMTPIEALNHINNLKMSIKK